MAFIRWDDEEETSKKNDQNKLHRAKSPVRPILVSYQISSTGVNPRKQKKLKNIK
jgi:hypothetical protein